MAFPSGWNRKQKITIQSSQISGSGSHSNFPMLITLDHLNAEIVDAGSNSALNGGGDIRFSSDSAGLSQIACEIVDFTINATVENRACEIWVKIPSLSTSTNTDIYIWYNKSGESQPVSNDTYGRNAVWSDYLVSLNFENTDNSTGGAGITLGSAATLSQGVLELENTSNDYATLDFSTSGKSNVTLETYATFDDSNTYSAIIDKSDTTDGPYDFAIWRSDENSILVAVDMVSGWSYANSNTGVCPAGSYHIVAVLDGIDITIYVDGVDVTNLTDKGGTAGMAENATTAYFGRHNADRDYYDGRIHQIFITDDIARSNAWVVTAYNNIDDASAFAFAGAPEFVDTGMMTIQHSNHNHLIDNVELEGGAIPIEYIGGAVNDSSSSTTLTLTLPTHQEDDFAIVYCRADEAGAIATWTETAAGGWAKLREDNFTEGRDRVEAIFYKKLSASESNPTFQSSVNEQISASVNIFRNVDPDTPFDVTEMVLHNQNDPTPPNPTITTANDNAALIVLNGQTHDDITTAGAPVGFTIATDITGSVKDHRQQVVAYQLDSGVAGLKTIGDWTHSFNNTASEYSTYTLALRVVVSNEETLEIADTNHSQTCDAIIITQLHDLSIAETNHGIIIPTIDLLIAYILALNDSVHIANSEEIVLSIETALAISSSASATGSDEINLTEANILSIAEGDISVSSPDIILNVQYDLIINQSNHEITSPQILVAETSDIGINSTLHEHNADNLEYSVFSDLIIQGASHDFANDNLVFDVLSTLDPAKGYHNHVSNQLDLSTFSTINISSALTATNSDLIALTQNQTVNIDETSHDQTSDALDIKILLSIEDNQFGFTSDQVALSQIHQLNLSNDFHSVVSDNPLVRVPPGIWALQDITKKLWNSVSAGMSIWTTQNIETNNWQNSASTRGSWQDQVSEDDYWLSPADFNAAKEAGSITSVIIDTALNNNEVISSPATTATVFISVPAPVITGGYGEYRYQWHRVGAGDQMMLLNGTDQATLMLSYTASPDIGATLEAMETWYVTVTDSVGTSLSSNDCQITLEVSRL